MPEKIKLQEYLDKLEANQEKRNDALDKKLERQIKRSNQTINLFLIFIFFVVSGSFAYTNRVAEKVDTACSDIQSISADLTDIDGALKARYPDSAIFGQRSDRERQKRGN